MSRPSDPPRVQVRMEDPDGRAVLRVLSWPNEDGSHSTVYHYPDGTSRRVDIPADHDAPPPSDAPLGPEWREVGFTTEEGDSDGSISG